jgi:hypothetical protein
VQFVASGLCVVDANSIAMYNGVKTLYWAKVAVVPCQLIASSSAYCYYVNPTGKLYIPILFYLSYLNLFYLFSNSIMFQAT